LPGAQLDFSAIPVPVSAVFLKRLSTYKFLDFKVAKWAVSFLTHSSNPFSNPFVFVPFVFGEKFPAAEF
jgi:hypothetical protein